MKARYWIGIPAVLLLAWLVKRWNDAAEHDRWHTVEAR